MRTLLCASLLALSSLFCDAQVTLVQDILPGVNSGWPANKIVFKDKLVFFANGGLKCYNDTTVSLISPNTFFSSDMTIADDKLYYCGSSNSDRMYMWDGVNPPSMVKDVNGLYNTSNTPDYFVTYNNEVYFYAQKYPSTVVNDFQLMQYSPSTNIIRRLSNKPGEWPKWPRYLAVFNNKIYFSAFDSGFYAMKLFVYDPLADTVGIAPNYDYADCSAPAYLTVCYNKLYFAANSSTFGEELYAYDGSSPPRRVSDINPGSGSSLPLASNYAVLPYHIIGYKGCVYFTASTGSSNLQLYKYDPKVDAGGSNPSLVYNINLDTYFGNYTSLIEFDDKLYFKGNDSIHGYELWMYDGVHDPAMVADINKDKKSSNPGYFAIYHNNLYFTATDSATGTELYRLGFPAGIENVSTITQAKVYPVPANRMLHFELNLKEGSSFAVALTDVTGREVYNSGVHNYPAGNAAWNADVSLLVPGNYYYRISTNNGEVLASGKVVKE